MRWLEDEQAPRPVALRFAKNLKYPVRPPMGLMEAPLCKTPGSCRRATSRSTTNSVVKPIRSPSIGLGSQLQQPPNLIAQRTKQPRRAELEDVRLLDLHYRQLLNDLHSLGIPGDHDLSRRNDPSLAHREHEKVARELYLSHRFLVCAVEVYLLGCVEYSGLTGEGAVKCATNTDTLITRLQAEEDWMIKTHGPPWVERTLP